MITAQSLLEGRGLRTRLLDDVMATALPVALSGFGRLQVQESQAALAKKILDGAVG